ncbi:xylanase precursor [Cladochytrium replicatum]|nr:xylanase precursor [Cladochytrium replicatum]
MRSLAAVFFLAAFVGSSSAQSCAALYGQCGGIGWTGPTTCCSGSTCNVINDYYFQCLAGSATSAKPTTTTTRAATTTTKTTTTAAATSSPAGNLPGTVVTVSTGTTYQKIDGFGGMNLGANWGNAALSASVITTAFQNLGLSILRLRIPPNTGEWSKLVASTKAALAFPDVKVFATPWSPPASMKTNNNVVHGSLSTSQYAAYANYLNSFVSFMSQNGISLYGVSVQNEPDWDPDYESCTWTPAQVLDFVKNQGGKITTRLLAAESLGMNKAYYDPLLNDATAVNNFDIVAGHIYGAAITSYPLASQKGKPVWMTEHLVNSNVGWAETLTVAQEIHNTMAAGWSAYVWWYIQRSYSFIDDSGNVLPRGWMFSHFAKNIRPGYVRVAATSPSSSIRVTSYTGSGKIATVLINTGSSAITMALQFPGSVTVNSAQVSTQSVPKPATLSTSINGGRNVVFTIPGSSIASIVVQ